MQQGSSAGGTAALTDEQILGMDEGLPTSGVNPASLASDAAGRSSGRTAERGLADQGGLAFDDILSAPGAGSSDASARTDAPQNTDAPGGAGEAEPA